MSFEQTAVSEAVQIGYDLADASIHYKDACTWVGRTFPDMADPVGPGPVSHALDNTLHGGVPGIGWFFADLCQIAPEPLFEDVLARTMRHVRRQGLDALARKPQDRPSWASSNQVGYYTGLTGALAFLARGHALLGTEDRLFIDLALQHLEAARRRPPTFDLMVGQAGAIPALLSLDAEHHPAARRLAQRYVRDLKSLARRRKTGVSWRGASTWHDDLTGLSHGNAGAAYALHIAAEHLEDEEARALADAAVAYENHWFLPEADNWPDLRVEPSPGADACRSYWCHGGPGIGLGRLAAPDAEQDMRIALARTQDQIQVLSDAPGSDHGLCHGLMGLVAVETTLATRLGADRIGPAVCDLAILRYGHEARKQPWSDLIEWPTGIPGQPVLGLMKGIAGVGHALLHAAHPELPTAMLPATPGINPIHNLSGSSHKPLVRHVDVSP